MVGHMTVEGVDELWPDSRCCTDCRATSCSVIDRMAIGTNDWVRWPSYDSSTCAGVTSSSP